MTYTEHPALKIQGLSKAYGPTEAVDDLHLVVQPGEIFGIIGTNGAGKTTAVECAQGLRQPDSGEVRILGLDPIGDRTKLRSRVGSQLQESNLPERMRVGEAVSLFADSKARAQTAMAEWDLGEINKTAFGRLSGGQKQRLFLALALLNQPQIVFLDELTQGLDPSARRLVWQLIEDVRDTGTTVVLVTHFLEEAEVLCDRVAVMVDGRLVDEGTPAELIDRHGGGVRMRFASMATNSSWLANIPGVEETRTVGKETEVRGADSAMIAHVGAAMIERDSVPSSIRVEQPNLEDALLPILAGKKGSL